MQRDGWSLKVFYSHSARAQELGRTRDWVVIVAARNGHPPSQHTVVTETRGKLAGRRKIAKQVSPDPQFLTLTPIDAETSVFSTKESTDGSAKTRW